MENAIKALLIAAAVIIAVLIISLVMGVFNTGSEQVNNNSDLSEYQIQQFNDKFTKYEGKNVSASKANAMIKTVFNHNLAQEDSSTMVEIIMYGWYTYTGTYEWGMETIVEATNSTESSTPKVPIGKKYEIEMEYDSKSKIIKKIKMYTAGETRGVMPPT